MNRSLLGFAFTAALGLSVVAAAAPRPTPDRGLVNTLDRVVQERFEKIDDTFGMERILRIDQPYHSEFRRFTPVGKAEKQAVAEVSEQGWDAILLVGSRIVTRTHPDHERRVMSQPLVLTGEKPHAALPNGQKILPAGTRAAFAAFAKGKAAHELQVDAWHMVARPIRASRKECLSCHKKDADGKRLKIGDPLGVAIYGFAPAAPPEAAQSR